MWPWVDELHNKMFWLYSAEGDPLQRIRNCEWTKQMTFYHYPSDYARGWGLNGWGLGGGSPLKNAKPDWGTEDSGINVPFKPKLFHFHSTPSLGLLFHSDWSLWWKACSEKPLLQRKKKRRKSKPLPSTLLHFISATLFWIGDETLEVKVWC